MVFNLTPNIYKMWDWCKMKLNKCNFNLNNDKINLNVIEKAS